jgi:hypothetical protein
MNTPLPSWVGRETRHPTQRANRETCRGGFQTRPYYIAIFVPWFWQEEYRTPSAGAGLQPLRMMPGSMKKGRV